MIGGHRDSAVGLIDARTGIEDCRPQQRMNLTAIINPDNDSDWLVAHNPETGTTTQGKTFDAALASPREATELYLSEFPAQTTGTLNRVLQQAGLKDCGICDTRL